jgi:8-oxo-dGTP pyrophosphatase MutT (NUDIX family)
MVSSRESLKKLIQAISPLDDVEKAHIEDALTWIDSGADLYRLQKPDIPSKHLVSYFVVYDQSRDLYLQVAHKLAGLWLPSGGHVEPGEDPEETVRRECVEELGVSAKFVQKQPLMVTVTQTIGQGEHWDVSLWYLLNGSSSDDFEWDRREFSEIRWWPKDEITAHGVEYFDPHILRFITKVEAR